MDAKNNHEVRVLMFPWLGYGHITPYLELAKKLTTRNFTVHLCSTAANLKCIDSKRFSSSSIKVVPLVLPTSPDLPAELHTTNGLPLHLMPRLKEAFDSSVESFSDIVRDVNPDILIYDFLQPWAPLVARDNNIPAVEFVTSSSTMTSLLFHHFRKPPGTPFPFPEIYFRHYEHASLKRLQECATKPEEKDMALAVERSCDIVLIKGFREMEGKYIDYVSSLFDGTKEFVPVGPLLNDDDDDDDDADDERGIKTIVSWLDGKEEKSTVFVSFGTEFYLSEQDMDEIAYGLELSKVNFVWALRRANNSGGLTLPEGFIERVAGRGLILEGWAPQAKILQHPNVGGFVSHCGWNSLIESMSYGVPIVAVPMHLDQPINARLVEAIGVGIEVLKDSEDKRVPRETLARVIRDVLLSESSVVRRNAAEMREIIRSKRDEEIDQVSRKLVEICNNFSK